MTLTELTSEAMKAWEAQEVEVGWHAPRERWFICLKDGKSRAVTGANTIYFLGKTAEEACEKAIAEAPKESMAELREKAMENMLRDA